MQNPDPKKYKRCELCCGRGYVHKTKRASRITDEQKRDVLKLRRKGLSYRDICSATGIKHPYSVQHIVRTCVTPNTMKTNPTEKQIPEPTKWHLIRSLLTVFSSERCPRCHCISPYYNDCPICEGYVIGCGKAPKLDIFLKYLCWLKENQTL